MRRHAVTLRHKHRRTPPSLISKKSWGGLFALWLSVSLAVPQSAWGLRPQLVDKAGLEQVLREESSSAAGMEELHLEHLRRLVQEAEKLPLIGEGYATRVYPFPGQSDLVVKVPKTYFQVVQAMRKAGEKLLDIPLGARRIMRRHHESYRWAQERGDGVFVRLRLYELPYRHLPYVVIQQRGEATVQTELRALNFTQDAKGFARAKEMLTENLDLRWRALTQRIWESVDNFTVNNVYVIEDGQRVQRIADAGEVKIIPPTPEKRNRTQQWSVTQDLPTIHPDLAPWYIQQIKRRFGWLSDEETAQLWKSQGSRPMDFKEADEALRAFVSTAGMEEGEAAVSSLLLSLTQGEYQQRYDAGVSDLPRVRTEHPEAFDDRSEDIIHALIKNLGNPAELIQAGAVAGLASLTDEPKYRERIQQAVSVVAGMATTRIGLLESHVTQAIQAFERYGMITIDASLRRALLILPSNESAGLEGNDKVTRSLVETPASPAAGMESIAERVIDIVAEQTGVDRDQIKPDTKIIELGVDSPKMVDIMLELEREFDVRFPGNEWAVEEIFQTVQTLVEYVEKEQAAGMEEVTLHPARVLSVSPLSRTTIKVLLGKGEHEVLIQRQMKVFGRTKDNFALLKLSTSPPEIIMLEQVGKQFVLGDFREEKYVHFFDIPETIVRKVAWEKAVKREKGSQPLQLEWNPSGFRPIHYISWGPVEGNLRLEFSTREEMRGPESVIYELGAIPPVDQKLAKQDAAGMEEDWQDLTWFSWARVKVGDEIRKDKKVVRTVSAKSSSKISFKEAGGGLLDRDAFPADTYQWKPKSAAGMEEMYQVREVKYFDPGNSDEVTSPVSLETEDSDRWVFEAQRGGNPAGQYLVSFSDHDAQWIRASNLTLARQPLETGGWIAKWNHGTEIQLFAAEDPDEDYRLQLSTLSVWVSRDSSGDLILDWDSSALPMRVWRLSPLTAGLEGETEIENPGDIDRLLTDAAKGSFLVAPDGKRYQFKELLKGGRVSTLFIVGGGLSQGERIFSKPELIGFKLLSAAGMEEDWQDLTWFNWAKVKVGDEIRKDKKVVRTVLTKSSSTISFKEAGGGLLDRDTLPAGTYQWKPKSAAGLEEGEELGGSLLVSPAAGMEGVLKIALGEENQENYSVLMNKAGSRVKIKMLETEQLEEFFENYPNPTAHLVSEPQLEIYLHKDYVLAGDADHWELVISLAPGAWEEQEMRRHLSEVIRKHPIVIKILGDEEILGEESGSIAVGIDDLNAPLEFTRNVTIKFFRDESGHLDIFVSETSSKNLAASVPAAIAIAARFLKKGTKLDAAGLEDSYDEQLIKLGLAERLRENAEVVMAPLRVEFTRMQQQSSQSMEQLMAQFQLKIEQVSAQAALGTFVGWIREKIPQLQEIIESYEVRFQVDLELPIAARTILYPVEYPTDSGRVIYFQPTVLFNPTDRDVYGQIRGLVHELVEINVLMELTLTEPGLTKAEDDALNRAEYSQWRTLVLEREYFDTIQWPQDRRQQHEERITHFAQQLRRAESTIRESFLRRPLPEPLETLYQSAGMEEDEPGAGTPVGPIEIGKLSETVLSVWAEDLSQEEDQAGYETFTFVLNGPEGSREIVYVRHEADTSIWARRMDEAFNKIGVHSGVSNLWAVQAEEIPLYMGEPGKEIPTVLKFTPYEEPLDQDAAAGMESSEEGRQTIAEHLLALDQEVGPREKFFLTMEVLGFRTDSAIAGALNTQEYKGSRKKGANPSTVTGWRNYPQVPQEAYNLLPKLYAEHANHYFFRTTGLIGLGSDQTIAEVFNGGNHEALQGVKATADEIGRWRTDEESLVPLNALIVLSKIYREQARRHFFRTAYPLGLRNDELIADAFTEAGYTGEGRQGYRTPGLRPSTVREWRKGRVAISDEALVLLGGLTSQAASAAGMEEVEEGKPTRRSGLPARVQEVYHESWVGALWRTIKGRDGIKRPGMWVSVEESSATGLGIHIDNEDRRTPLIRLRFDTDRLDYYGIKFSLPVPDAEVYAPLGFYRSKNEVPLYTLPDDSKKKLKQALLRLAGSGENYPISAAEIDHVLSEPGGLADTAGMEEVSRRDFLGTTGRVAAGVAAGIPLVGRIAGAAQPPEPSVPVQPPTGRMSLRGLVREIRQTIKNGFLTLKREDLPSGDEVADLGDTPLFTALQGTLERTGYQGDWLRAVTAESVRGTSIQPPAVEQEVEQLIYISPNSQWRGTVTGNFPEKGRYQVTTDPDDLDNATAVVVDARTPEGERERLIALGKTLFEIRTLKDAQALTPALIDHLVDEGIILPHVGTLIVIQSLTAPGFKEIVLIFA